MALEQSQIKKLLQRPNKQEVIQKAIEHENRIRFHVENFLSPSFISRTVNDFLSWVSTLLPKDKYSLFLSLFKYPTPIIQLTDLIFKELERVFDGKNPSFNYQFTDSFFAEDWEHYRREVLKEPVVWRKQGWDAVRTAINSVLIVDVPPVQTGDLPEPYFYWLNIEHVIDYKLAGTSAVEYIIFKQPLNKVAVFDDEFYRVFQLNDKGEIAEMLTETEHGLGYCPARFFWSTELTKKTPDLKKSPLSPQLYNLDWLLFFETSKKNLDIYASYPIYSAYAQDCDFENSQTGSYCDGGYLRGSNKDYIFTGSGNLATCPVCYEKRLAGPGSYVEMPIPGNGDPDLKDPVKIIGVDRNSLDYNTEEVERRERKVFSSVVGFGDVETSKQALNEMQVSSNFESRTAVLNSLKGNLEAAQKFVDDTVCNLRYGDDFLSSSISWGTDFYIYTVGDLREKYKAAKETGATEAELDAILSQMIATEYRNNPLEMQRMLILKQLEPYRHRTFNELMELQTKGLIEEEALKMKLNFPALIERFERENINVIEFGSQLDFSRKIKIINEKLKGYVKEGTTQRVE